MKFYITHVKVHIADAVQKHFMPIIAALALAAYFATPNKIAALKFLMKSHRYHPFDITTKLVKNNLSRIQENAVVLFDGEDKAGEEIQRKRGLILKNPIFNREGQCVEKGVYLITFTGTLQFYIRNIDVNDLQKYFHIVLEPSWAGYCLSEILWWGKLNDKVVIQSTEIRDYDFIKSLDSSLVPTTFGASDWVNQDTFKYITPPPEKTYDAIYVSNHNSIKRNHVFLKTISKIKDPSFKAALVCSGWGNNRDYNLELMKRLHLYDRIDLIEKLNQHDLNIILNKSKVNILLSLKEGSNRSLFEGFFAGTPGIILKNNVGANKTYFTEQSGSAINEAELPETLLWYKYNWQKLSAHTWATENISIFKTKDKLDDLLKQISEAQGLQWTTGTCLKVNSPEATLYSEDDASNLLKAREILEIFRVESELSKTRAQIMLGMCKV